MTPGNFLKAQLGHAGAWNCSTLAADYCIALGYPDFAADWRDIVEPGECEAVPREAGGLVALWERGIGEGLPLAAEPYFAGDIAVICVLGIDAGAVFTGERWAIRRPRGLFMAASDHVSVVKAWRP